jgi:hypothetical protein
MAVPVIVASAMVVIAEMLRMLRRFMMVLPIL